MWIVSPASARPSPSLAGAMVGESNSQVLCSRTPGAGSLVSAVKASTTLPEAAMLPMMNRDE